LGRAALIQVNGGSVFAGHRENHDFRDDAIRKLARLASRRWGGLASSPGAPSRRGCGFWPGPRFFTNHIKEYDMQWIDPAYCDIRLGFEVTAYVYVR